MKKAKPKKKPRRVVLGVGRPWFSESLTSLTLAVSDSTRAKQVMLDIQDLGAYNRIRLVAEVLR